MSFVQYIAWGIVLSTVLLRGLKDSMFKEIVELFRLLALVVLCIEVIGGQNVI